MEPKLIDLNDFILAGGGFMGESYNHRDNPGIMLKLYPLDWAHLAVKEYDRAGKALALGVPTPEPKDLVKVPDGRMGIIFQRIQGKKSYARAVGEDPSRTEELATRLAALCRTLHSTRVNKEELPSTKEYYINLISTDPFLTSAQKDKVLRFIADIPEADTALHGDLHFGNAIFRGDESWLIDIGEFGYGNPLWDLGIFMSAINYTPEEMIRKLYHTDKSTAIRFWQVFLRAYSGGDRPLKELEEEIKPYAALRSLMVQRVIGRLIPERRPLVECLFA
jgi:uncharacterized protein (TIGR02172 family)